MKKFLAGLLAAVSALSLSAPAYAASSKTVNRQKEITYEVVAEMPDVVLKVSLPSQLKAALNPYGNEIQIDELNSIRTTNGIVSVAYPVHNLDTDYGVFVDATAITSTSSRSWSVSTTALSDGVKGANMCLRASDTEAGITTYSAAKKAATGFADQGNLPLDSTIPADRAKGTAKGQTSQTKLAYVPASADGTTPKVIYIGFAGKLSEDSAETPVNWTESDTINVNLILRITPGPKTLA